MTADEWLPECVRSLQPEYVSHVVDAGLAFDEPDRRGDSRREAVPAVGYVLHLEALT